MNSHEPNPRRIGQLLSQMVPLSDHDVEEILHEQSASNRRFGEVALQLGLATPEHVLRAWMHQLETRTERVSIETLGVDTQALAFCNRTLARKHGALPVRAIEGDVLVALAKLPDAAAVNELESFAGRRIKIVLADESELLNAIDRHYPAHRAVDAA